MLREKTKTNGFILSQTDPCDGDYFLHKQKSRETLELGMGSKLMMMARVENLVQNDHGAGED